MKWIDDPSNERLIAVAIVEDVFFSSSFAAAFWLCRLRGVVPGLVQATTMIARDEGMHMTFACLLSRELPAVVDVTVVHGMIGEAVRLEHSTVRVRSS